MARANGDDADEVAGGPDTPATELVAHASFLSAQPRCHLLFNPSPRAWGFEALATYLLAIGPKGRRPPTASWPPNRDNFHNSRRTAVKSPPGLRPRERCSSRGRRPRSQRRAPLPDSATGVCRQLSLRTIALVLRPVVGARSRWRRGNCVGRSWSSRGCAQIQRVPTLPRPRELRVAGRGLNRLLLGVPGKRTAVVSRLGQWRARVA